MGTRPRPVPRFYLPSVLLPPEAAKSPTVHKIHILGEDERSRFIAHALSGVYESVELLGWKKNPSRRYNNVQKLRPSRQVEPNQNLTRTAAPLDTSRIDHLLVTGQGHEVSEALESVKDRLDDGSTVCMINDGLGVLEDVRRRIFDGTQSVPNFFLGHMSHRFAYNRNMDSVKQLKGGVMKLTAAELPSVQGTERSHHGRGCHKTEARPDFVKTLQEVKDLRTSLTPWDQWLRFKLPSVVFDSVVEPVCLILETSYQGLRQNPAAQRMMHNLLSEIMGVVEQMPEVRESATIRDLVHGKSIDRYLYGRIIAKRSQPGKLVRRVQHGLPTDVDYLNGYFLRRGRQLGLDLPVNNTVKEMIKAKHSQAIEKLNSYIPMEGTSVPSHLEFRYRTTPREDD